MFLLKVLFVGSNKLHMKITIFLWLAQYLFKIHLKKFSIGISCRMSSNIYAGFFEYKRNSPMMDTSVQVPSSIMKGR